jgi:hypothetical protein
MIVDQVGAEHGPDQRQADDGQARPVAEIDEEGADRDQADDRAQRHGRGAEKRRRLDRAIGEQDHEPEAESRRQDERKPALPMQLG